MPRHTETTATGAARFDIIAFSDGARIKRGTMKADARTKFSTIFRRTAYERFVNAAKCALTAQDATEVPVNYSEMVGIWSVVMGMPQPAVAGERSRWQTAGDQFNDEVFRPLVKELESRIRDDNPGLDIACTSLLDIPTILVCVRWTQK
jgi:hypothetical protein